MRGVVRVTQRPIYGDWPTLLLLAGYQLLLFRSVTAAGWGERIEATPYLAISGALAGLVTARSYLRMPWSVAAGALLGIECALLAQAIYSPGREWSEKVVWTLSAVGGWLLRSLGSGLSHDIVAFSVVMSSLAYTVGFGASWLLFRYQRPWSMLVLTGAFGLVHLSYATVDSIPPYLFALLVGALTVASFDFHLRRARWRAAGVPTPASLLWTLTATGAMVGAALLAGLALPAGSSQPLLAAGYQRLTEPFADIGRQVNRLFGDGTRGLGPGDGPLAFATTVFPRESFELGDRPLLKVETEGRYYWRAITYDRYDGHSIASSATAEARIPALEPLPLDPGGAEERRLVTQRVTVLGDRIARLVAAAEPLHFDLDTDVERRAAAWDIVGVSAPIPLQEGQAYTVVSAVREPAIDELVAASGEYPAWLEHYLQLPSNLPERVGALAARVASRAGSPFERASAIEAYLRGLTYSTRTSAPPPDRDWVDYLLFDTQTGYCDYLATAMMVMLRSQGIPARVASGFASGDFDQTTGVWIVRERDTHSWTEAYIPGVGWVPFEPSASREPPTRSASRANREGRNPLAADPVSGRAPLVEPLDEFVGSSTATQGTAATRSLFAELLLGLAIVLSLAGAACATVALAWERGLRDQPRVARRFAHVQRLAALAGLREPPWQTPLEQARSLGEWLPEGRNAILALTELYVEETYRGSTSASSAAKAEQLWQRLRGPLLRRVLRRWLRWPSAGLLRSGRGARRSHLDT